MRSANDFRSIRRERSERRARSASDSRSIRRERLQISVSRAPASEAGAAMRREASRALVFPLLRVRNSCDGGPPRLSACYIALRRSNNHHTPRQRDQRLKP